MMNRPSPPKPWERNGSSTTTAGIPPRSISPTGGTTLTNQINTSNGSIPSPSPTTPISQSGSIMNRPRTPMRPGGSSLYNSSYGDDSTGYGGMRPYSNGSYGSSSYGGSTYGSGGYGSSSYGGGYGSSSYGGGYGSSSYGSSYGGGYGNSYGGYGGSSYGGGYNSYGSTYGGGYGGYGGSSYGGGYYPRGGNELYDNMNKPGGAHGWMEALHSIVDTFSRFSRLLDANFDAVHVSFISILRLCQSVTHFNREILGMIKTFTIFKLLQPLGSRILRLLRFILGRPVTSVNKNTISNTIATTAAVSGSISKTSLHQVGETLQGIDVSDFKAFEKSQGKGIGYFILIIFVTFIGIPTLIGHLMQLSRNRKKDQTQQLESSWSLGEVTKVRSLYDFDAETPRDLPLRVGDIVNVIGKPHEEWWEGEIDGRTGLFPLCYVQILDENNNPINLNNNNNQQMNFNSNNSFNSNNIDTFSNNNNSIPNNNFSDYQLSSNNISFDNNNNNSNQLKHRPKSPKQKQQQIQ